MFQAIFQSSVRFSTHQKSYLLHLWLMGSYTHSGLLIYKKGIATKKKKLTNALQCEIIK